MKTVTLKQINEAEQRIVAKYNDKLCGSSEKIGPVEIIGKPWRRNPPSGMVTEHCRISFKMNGKSVSRAEMEKAIQS